MTPRSLLALVLITVVAVLGALFVWLGGRDTNASFEQGAPFIATLSEQGTAVGAITVKAPAYQLDLSREGDRWIASTQSGYPASEDTVNRFLGELADLKIWEPRTSTPELYASIGVDEVAEGGQSNRVTLTSPDGAVVADLLVGIASRSIGANPAGGVFVRRPDEAQSWLAEGFATIPPNVGGWFQPVLHIPGPDLQKVEIREGDRPVLVAAKPEGGVAYETVSAAAPLPADAQVDDAVLKQLTQALVSAAFTAVRPSSEVTFAADARQLVFTTVNGLRIDMRIGEADGAAWITVVATAENDAAAEMAEAINQRAQTRAFQFEAGKMAMLETPVEKLVASALPPADAP